MTDVDPGTLAALRDLARRVTELDGRVRDQARASQARDRSVEGGAQALYDEDDELRAIVGEQADGSYTITTFGGAAPNVPSAPLVAVFPGGATVTWDGYDDQDEQGWPADFARVTVHLSTIPDDPAPVDLEEYRQHLAETQVASFESPEGGAVGLTQPSDVTTYCTLVAWTAAGIPSGQSLEVEVTGGDLPDTTPTTAPAESPAVRAYGFADAILLRADTVAASTLIQYHMRPADPDTLFVPVVDDPATLVGVPTRSAIQLVTATPDGVVLDLTATYDFATIATNVVGAAAPSWPVQGKCDASALTEQIMATVVAGFALVGALNVGGSLVGGELVGGIRIDPDEGIVIPQPDGGTITFPADGMSFAQITAHLVAKSLNVEDTLTISGSGKVEGDVSLADGVTAPVAPLSLSKTWPKVQSGMSNGTVEFDIFRDFVPRIGNSAQMVTVYNFFGAGMRVYTKNTGVQAVYPDPTDALVGGGSDWVSSFYPDGGIASDGSYYYVLGSDGERSGGWYIYKIHPTTWTKVDEYLVTAYGNFPNHPRIAYHAGALYIVYKSTANNLVLRKHTASTLAYVSQRALIADWSGGNIGGVTIADATLLYGTHLYIAGRNTNILAWDADDANYVNWDPMFPSLDFPWANNALLHGLEYDPVDGRFMSFDGFGRWYFYGKNAMQTTLGGLYSHYDGDTSNYPAGHPDAGTPSATHETEGGPASSYVVPARAWVHVEADPPPDLADLDATHVDKANRLGIYLGPVGSEERQDYLPVGVRAKDYDPGELDYGTGGPPTTNQFLTDPKVSAAPGRLYSTGSDADGPLIDLNGSGDGRAGPSKWDSEGKGANTIGLRATADQSAVTDNTARQVTLAGTVDHESDGMTAASSVVTVAEEGLYHVHGSCTINGSGSRTLTVERFTSEAVGAGTAVAGKVLAASGRSTLACESDVWLTAGTKLRLVILHVTGSAQNIVNSVMPAQLNVRRVG